MSAVSQDNQAQIPEAPKNDKEYNFAQIRQQLDREKQEKAQLREEVEKLKKLTQEKFAPKEDDDADDEPYVDHKSLAKKLAKFESSMDEKIDKKAQEKARDLFEAHKRDQWLKNNPDFYDILQHAQAFADRDPELAETILEMPEGFERQKLVYKNIKALGLHKPPEPKSTIQDKIDQNRRSPYYQPSGVANAPYAATGDFSESGQQNSYKKMKELQKRLRM